MSKRSDKGPGFFTRENRVRPTTQSAEYAKKLGPKGCKSHAATNPHLSPVGENTDFFILAACPTSNEDKRGQTFFDRLYDIEAVIKDPRCDYVVRTHLGNKNPTEYEVECYRSEVIREIRQSKPKVIIAMGSIPTAWLFPGGTNPIMLRGRSIPVRVGSHRCWMVPTMDPLKFDKTSKSVDEFRETFKRDLKLAKSVRKWPLPDNNHGPFLGGVSHCASLDEFTDSVKRLPSGPLSIDLETRGLRPYGNDSIILSIAIGTFDTTYSVGFEHPEAPELTEDILARFAENMESIFQKREFVAHNASFEIEWLSYFLGDCVYRARWHDTRAMAYILDERTAYQNLRFLCMAHLEVDVKGKSAVNAQNDVLESVVLSDLLDYNATDVKYTYLLFLRLRELLEQDDLYNVYEMFVNRVPAVVRTQIKGVPVDFDVLEDLRDDYQTKLDDINDMIMRLPATTEFPRKHGRPFSATAPDDVRLLLGDIGYVVESTDKEVLDSTDHPIAELVVGARRYSKLLSTYVNNYLAGENVWPDGRLHTSYGTTVTVTGRLASEEPNLQNFPKRRDRSVRSMVRPPKGSVILSVDYGQIEARVIAMASKDKVLVKALWDDYDIHRAWAELIDRAMPGKADEYGGIDKLRSVAKNKFVFPAFFGAHRYSITRDLGLSDKAGKSLFERFWSEFNGVKRWQDDLLREYKRKGYVTGLTGRRRRAPLGPNHIFNNTIQGAASDLVIASMERLTKLSLDLDWYALQPVMNIHDDITFILSESEVDEALEFIIPCMLEKEHSWINVPLTVDAEIGYDWYEQETIGSFSSEHYV